MRQDTLAAYVVLSAREVSGLTLRQVADYAAMSGLASVRTNTALTLPHPSILTMIADHASGHVPQDEATHFDLAFLRALYSGDTGFTFEQKSLSMAIQVDQDLRNGSAK